VSEDAVQPAPVSPHRHEQEPENRDSAIAIGGSRTFAISSPHPAPARADQAALLHPTRTQLENDLVVQLQAQSNSTGARVRTTACVRRANVQNNVAHGRGRRAGMFHSPNEEG